MVYPYFRFGVLKDDSRVDDYDDISSRSGFRLHLGSISWGCVTVNKNQENGSEKWNEVQDLFKNTKTIELDYNTGPHWWNSTKKIKSYGYITK